MNYIIGYDPGGKDAHGVAALSVLHDGKRYCGTVLDVACCRSVQFAIDWIFAKCADGRIIAAGIDTLTEWNSGDSGWRPADWWLRKQFPAMAGSVASPNFLRGAMGLNGGAFLHLLAPRFAADRTMVTEAHPKVCYYALTNRRPDWPQQPMRDEMIEWLKAQLSCEMQVASFGQLDHTFDAAMSVLAALRGLNGEWTINLHGLTDPKCGAPVRPFGESKYWWPCDTRIAGAIE